jgi:hypothetical protein
MRRCHHWSIVRGFCLLLLASTTLLSAEGPADRSLLTVDRILGKDEFKTQDWGPARWLKDGSAYTTLEVAETSKDNAV